MAYTLKKLRELPLDKLIAQHDNTAEGTNFGLAYFQQEIFRREQEEQTRLMLRYTRWITVMTIVMTIATIINVVISFKLLH